MIFSNRLKFIAVAVIALGTLLVSCEQDLTSIGSGVVGSEPFNTDKAVFDVFATNKKIKAVRTNKLPSYQLGVFSDPVYGKTEATITSQVQLSTINPTFGDKTQAREVSDGTPENETIESVILYIPFLQSPSGDTDNDGLIDSLDSDPLDPNSDTDGDGLTDNQENSKGTDPLVMDTDGDGINDDVDNEFVRDQFARDIDIDSIYGNRNAPFTLRLQRSNFFLRDLDPDTNFQEAQEYYSDQDFSAFLTEEIAVVSDSIDEKQILVPREDDPDTEDIDEGEQFDREEPGIRVELPIAFFQENILDREGSSELLNQANFNDFLRGVHFSLEPAVGEELMVLFNMRAANITISYSYTAEEETKNKSFVLNFLTQPANASGQPGAIVGNAVNSFVNDDYAPEISEAIASDDNAERIYIKGDAGSFAEINLFDDANGKEAITQIKANNWIINEANLVFYVDEAVGADLPPRLYLYSTISELPLIGNIELLSPSNGVASYPFYDGFLEDTGSERKYTVKITDYINDLVVRNADNATLGLTFTPDIRIFNLANAMLADGTETNLPVSATLSPLGTVLYGSNVAAANAGKKLQLEIFYTEAN
ncbi:hypothetical protein LCGC14_1130710 [marine sediment metagenome]|uniref:DUF4270 domain-containing protein n=2 Tax=root TaxID=1 RepID=A0A831VN14_9FLAO|nr:DUF4270 domain-containing protein [Pricia sp.]HEA20386.1 DUF4270 domain-containing protein [Pricia antarctica]